MERKRKLFLAKTAVVAGAVPFLIWAHEYGPDAGYSGVPGEFGTCTAAGCHTGTTNNPANKGSVAINFPNGNTYTPGVRQHLTVTIADPAATQRAWGFQLTARQAGSTTSMAGSFASDDANTGVQCAAVTNPANDLGQLLTQGQTQVCPANKTLSYIEHTLPGYTATKGMTGSATYQFDWTPPATNVGNITFYVAGNAANGDLTSNGDHIYATTVTVTPASTANAPAISDNGVVSGASFASGIVPLSWVTIQGTNLASTTDNWNDAIVNGQLPATLDNVSVSIGGKPAYVNYISPTQINVLAPDVGAGSMSVTVTNSGVTSSAVTATSQTVGPAFFLWAGKYAVATRQDFSWAVANGTFPTVATAPAKPGDVIILWGTGFGPTTPAAPVGVVVPSSATYSTSSPVTVTVGGTNATVYGAALAPGFAGLYQVAIQIPASAPNGDLPVVATINGAQSPATTLITVHN